MVACGKMWCKKGHHACDLESGHTGPCRDWQGAEHTFSGGTQNEEVRHVHEKREKAVVQARRKAATKTARRKPESLGALTCGGCGKPTQRLTFYGDKGYGPCCYYAKAVLKVSTFPYTTTHFNGKPIQVSSLSHLRRLERDFKTTCVAYSMDEANFNKPPQQDPSVQRPYENKENLEHIRRGSREAIEALRG